MMADAIAQGIHDVDPQVAVKVFNVSKHDKNDYSGQCVPLQGRFCRLFDHE